MYSQDDNADTSQKSHSSVHGGTFHCSGDEWSDPLMMLCYVLCVIMYYLEFYVIITSAPCYFKQAKFIQ